MINNQAFLKIGNTILRGDEITKYHMIHMSCSYHCLNCGGNVGYNSYFVNEENCPHCNKKYPDEYKV